MKKTNSKRAVKTDNKLILFKDKTSEVIAIEKDGNGAYWVQYGYNNVTGQSYSSAGKFDTYQDAKQTLKKHRPTAKQTKSALKQNSRNTVKSRFGNPTIKNKKK